MKTLIGYAKNYRSYILSQLFFAGLWVVTNLAIPYLMGLIIDNGIMVNDMTYVVNVGLAMIGVTILNVLTLLANLYFLTQVNSGVSRDLRNDIFDKVINWSAQTRKRFSTSTLITRNVNDVKQVSNFIDLSLRKIYTVSITIIGAVIVSFTLDWELSLIMLIIVPIVLIISSQLTSRSVPQYTKIRGALDKIDRLFRQNLSGIRVVKAFGKTDYEEAQFSDAVEEAYDANVKAERTMMLLAPLITLFVNVLILFILWRGGVRADAGTIQVGILIAIIEYVTMALTNVQQFASIITVVPRSMVSLNRIEEVLGHEEEILQPTENKLQEGLKVPEKGIRVSDVTFAYDEGSVPALQNATFDIRPQWTVALIGSIGSGKSTLIQLLLRDYEVDAGSIEIEGHDIKSLSAEDFNQLFTVIPQQSFLFSGSIRENIQVGKADASDEEIWQVLEIAQMADYFRNSEKGLDTHIAQGGVNFSGGQQQRLSLARGIIRDTPYYIFDDTFSALDFSTEKKVRKGIQEHLRDKTLLIVAQRVATVEDSDEILVLEEGRITNRGRHEELVERSTVYQEIIASQLQPEEEIS